MINNYSARPPVEILLDLYYLKVRKDKGESISLPLLTLMLPGKLPLSGFLIDFKKDNHNAYHISVEVEGSDAVFFAETYFVQGVVVHDIEKIDYLLTEITSENVSRKRIPTKLEIKVTASEESRRLSAYFSKPLEISFDETEIQAEHLFFLKNIIIDFSMCLLLIGEEEPGKSAVADSVDELIFRRGDTLAISLKNKILSITHPLTNSYSTRQRRSDLHEQIIQVI